MSKSLNAIVDNKELQPQDNPILLGNFAPVDKESSFDELEVIGTIPKELKGTLLRTGPNPVAPGPNHHWFVGDGMLHAIQLGNGEAKSYRNRWVRTKALEEKTGLAAAVGSQVELMIQGSGNVNVVGHAGRVLALPEVGLPYEMDTRLNTKGLYDYAGKLASNMTAHPKIDGRTGEMLFFGYEVFAPFLRYHEASANGDLIKSIDIDLPEGIMMHDFGVTQSRIIFMDLPVAADLSLMEKGFGMPFQWNDAHQSRLGIMDRSSETDTVKWIDIDPCFVFHPLNSYDDGDKIVMDVVRYQKMMTAEGDNDYEQGSNLVRWVIDPAAGTVETTVLRDIDMEFPRVNPKFECYQHQYGYALMTGGEQGFSDLLKFDLEAGTTQTYKVGDNCAGGEPVFVGSSNSEAEDDGYILSVVYNGDTELSELHIIDAQTFSAQPLAIVKLGARVPFGFHGNFVID
jgi:carotenoid cleavage dioxygenase